MKVPAVAERWDLGEDEVGAPGAFMFEGQEKGLFFMCPCGCKAEGFLPFRSDAPGRPAWNWDGNRAAPTLMPSVLQLNCGWHGWLRGGVWEPC
jgi:hypothetical protein